MLNITHKFQPIIRDVRVLKYEWEEDQMRIHIQIRLKDDSHLVVRDYKFSDNSRKYSYHWMDENGDLRIRWDNVPHWKNIPTFPHHKHIEKKDNVVGSTETDLESVLTCISKKLK